MSGPSSDQTFEFVRLSDLPEMIEACAQMNDTEWGDGSDDSLEMRRAAFRRLALAAEEEDAILCLASNGDLAAMALLIENDLPEFPDLGPWLASLIVAPAYRKQGLSGRLIGEVENLAREFGHEALFIYTRSPQLYHSCGYQDVEQHNVDDALFHILGKAL
ncbi:GNAT family N-acetyltransferase [uncultured Cohaesibacter sp.]|uniref:GNAT family N-acetyltransferase n=1 Tax=uncultured Cohaesibacter sp. TaxID=1002546 RepID=UPI0029C8326E|nr:GNAT family N-acetyltransferase [uncultured Cohaesibacter sp.]